MEEKAKQVQKTKRKRRSKVEMLQAKSKENLVSGNVDKSFMITKVQKEDCYVYAVKRVSFDSTMGRSEEGATQIITYRQASVHKSCVWENGEIKVNVKEQLLKAQYGFANVVLINDPFDTYE